MCAGRELCEPSACEIIAHWRCTSLVRRPLRLSVRSRMAISAAQQCSSAAAVQQRQRPVRGGRVQIKPRNAGQAQGEQRMNGGSRRDGGREHRRIT